MTDARSGSSGAEVAFRVSGFGFGVERSASTAFNAAELDTLDSRPATRNVDSSNSVPVAADEK
jgi:hypothetical protein